MRTVLTPGIIIKKQPFGETDSCITIYSPIFGKIRAVAKGSRKITSRWMGHIEPPNFCQIQLYKNGDNFTVTQCQIEKSYKKISENLEKLTTAMRILEAFQKNTHGQEQCQELFNLLEYILHKLNTASQPFIILEECKLKLLQINGAIANLALCGFCNRRWTPESKIRLGNDGRFSCEKCNAKSQNVYNQIDFAVIKLANYLIKAQIIQKQKILLSDAQKQQLQRITEVFINHFLGTAASLRYSQKSNLLFKTTGLLRPVSRDSQ